ncbi:hypothetical protein RhiJN_24454 [Ceratobasidium sp. AG-Ba]|nr:hypothetical protein RhiJN_24454 [Ceratobasidium sp. AG-Ba]
MSSNTTPVLWTSSLASTHTSGFRNGLDPLHPAMSSSLMIKARGHGSSTAVYEEDKRQVALFRDSPNSFEAVGREDKTSARSGHAPMKNFRNHVIGSANCFGIPTSLALAVRFALALALAPAPSTRVRCFTGVILDLASSTNGDAKLLFRTVNVQMVQKLVH